MSLAMMIVAAITIYVCRVSGFLLHDRLTASAWNQRLSFVPIGVFSALIVTSVMGQADLALEKTLILLMTGLFIARTRRLGMGTLLGVAIFWALESFR